MFRINTEENLIDINEYNDPGMLILKLIDYKNLIVCKTKNADLNQNYVKFRWKKNLVIKDQI